MKKILIVNGPNINMLGIREPDIYGKRTYADLEDYIYDYCRFHEIEVEIYQSNHEGALVDAIQRAYFDKFEGIVINPGAYTHTSIAILDALKATNLPFVEVHISNLSEREDYRQISYIRPFAKASIMGHGFEGYIEAIKELNK